MKKLVELQRQSQGKPTTRTYTASNVRAMELAERLHTLSLFSEVFIKYLYRALQNRMIFIELTIKHCDCLAQATHSKIIGYGIVENWASKVEIAFLRRYILDTLDRVDLLNIAYSVSNGCQRTYVCDLDLLLLLKGI